MFQVPLRRRICSGFGVWTHLWPGSLVELLLSKAQLCFFRRMA
jgi:hypothetical protein